MIYMNHKVGMSDMEIDIDGDIILYKALDHLLILLRILFFLTSEKCAYVMPHKSCHYGKMEKIGNGITTTLWNEVPQLNIDTKPYHHSTDSSHLSTKV